ncbi:MAG: hypothetical protein OHK0045_22310 [Raineya sp.]
MKVTNSMLKMPKLRFGLGEEVFVFTKDGMKKTQIVRISVDFYLKETVVYYFVRGHAIYDEPYFEHQLTKTNEALERLHENVKQLQLNFLQP